MIKANILETNLKFGSLSRRKDTNKIVIHHTGSVKDVDFSAARIHDLHKGNGWVGIGYHFVIRKDGTIERGRPIWAIGSHAQGHNICAAILTRQSQPTSKLKARLSLLLIFALITIFLSIESILSVKTNVTIRKQTAQVAQVKIFNLNLIQ